MNSFTNIFKPLVLFGSFSIGVSACFFEKQVDYSLDVKPILNKKCISCHGGVKKNAGFSLLFEEEAFAKLKSGKFGIVPGSPEKSEMIRRINLHDVEDRMPYKANPLSSEEIETLTTWVKQGAKWGQHWAYKSVEKPQIPNVKSDWIANNIDAYVLEKQQDKSLKHAEQADANYLARRASLDLVGLPINNIAKNIYLKNPTNKNYESLIDTLLALPQFGEKWTSMWLDLARYADTKGYERDGGRSIWRYRDWLVNAFNSDKPYDQFLIEQLAGDLLPKPTDDQLIATAFHRNTMTNDEGGTDNEEFRTAAVLDRVNTTWETLMGTTFACVQCHSHPYDPFKHEDYYRFASFFNNTRDEDTYDDYPLMRHFNDAQNKKLGALNNWLTANCTKSETANILKFIKTFEPTYNSITTDKFVNGELSDTKWLAFRKNGSARLKKVDLTAKTTLVFKYKAYVGGGQIHLKADSINGPEIGVYPIKSETKSWQIISINLLPFNGIHPIYFTYNSPKLKDDKQTGVVFDWFYFSNNFPGENKKAYNEAKSNYWDLVNAQTETTPIMSQNPQDLTRENNVFIRGNWTMKGEKVVPGVPKIFSNFINEQPKDRLEMAKWMTSAKHPLTARTIVNRLWEQLFGTGLVETLEDIGSQGAAPSNQKLLDYLSYKLANEYHWSLKKLLKEIMLSATYKQDSKLTPENAKTDLANEFFTRGPRIRLSAEQIRDQALAISGVLNAKMGGPPVMPWQPKGIWHSPYADDSWKNSAGNEQYRRAVYTFWKRTSAYPSMLSFDGVGREVCSSRRIRTNTPLQALVTLNDSAYVDISRKFTQKVISTLRTNPELQIIKMFEIATERNISQPKLQILLKLYQKSLFEYKAKPKEVDKICKGIKIDNKAEFAALAIVANAILNLDEILTKS
jgi:Protein of unknown function (DUF1553)/Protein of unknown function (DUF1549)/Planctomycete cytochrome C